MSNTDLIRSTWVDADRMRLFMQRIVLETQLLPAQRCLATR